MKTRFLNQKLGKRVNRKLDLLKAKLHASEGGSGRSTPKVGAHQKARKGR